MPESTAPMPPPVSIARPTSRNRGRRESHAETLSWVRVFNKPETFHTLTGISPAGEEVYLVKDSLPQPKYNPGFNTWWFDSEEVILGSLLPYFDDKEELDNFFDTIIHKLVEKFGKIEIITEVEFLGHLNTDRITIIWTEEEEFYNNPKTSTLFAVVHKRNLLDINSAFYQSKEDVEAAKAKLEEEAWFYLDVSFNRRARDAAESIRREIVAQKQQIEITLASLIERKDSIRILEQKMITPKSLMDEVEKLKKMKSIKRFFPLQPERGSLITAGIVIETVALTQVVGGVCYFMGEFRITIGEREPKIENLSMIVNERFFHPHVTTSGVCWGSFYSAVISCVTEREYADLVNLLITYLCKYKANDAYIGIDCFPTFKDDKILAGSNIKWLKSYPNWGIA